MRRLLSTLLQAPGIITHELAHALFCLLSGVPIYKICLLRFRDPPGFVEHGEPEDFVASILITFGPLMVNSLLALVIAAQITTWSFQLSTIFWTWLSLAIGLQALPSDGDIEALMGSWKFRLSQQWLLILFVPFIPIVYVFYLLKKLHGRTLYAAALLFLGAWYLKIHG
jgi:hypothetical protein